MVGVCVLLQGGAVGVPASDAPERDDPVLWSKIVWVRVGSPCALCVIAVFVYFGFPPRSSPPFFFTHIIVRLHLVCGKFVRGKASIAFCSQFCFFVEVSCIVDALVSRVPDLRRLYARIYRNSW